MTVGEVLRRATEHLGKTSETARLDAELLLAHTLGRQRIDLYTDFDRPLENSELDGYRELVARRARREPVAYILGEWGFRRLTLATDRAGADPEARDGDRRRARARPSARARGSTGARRRHGERCDRARDRGRAAERPVTAIDVSPDALALARENAARTGLTIELLEHDLRAGLPGGPYDLVVSNPPYVEPDELPTLMPDVREFEPHLALVGSGATEAVARTALTALVPEGWLVLEVGDGQASATAALLGGLGYADVSTTPDLTGRDRVVEGRRV